MSDDIFNLIRLMRDPETRYTFGPKAADLLELQAKRIEELQKTIDGVCSAIKTNRFMDPPDGGDVSLPEQVKRLFEETELRWRQIEELERVNTNLRVERCALTTALEARDEEMRLLEARIAELEAKLTRLSDKKIISTDVTRERIYNAIGAWTSASDTVCSCATEAIIRIVNDHFGG